MKTVFFSVNDALSKEKSSSEYKKHMQKKAEDWNNNLSSITDISSATKSINDGKQLSRYFEKTGNSETASQIKKVVGQLENNVLENEKRIAESNKYFTDYNNSLSTNPYVIEKDTETDNDIVNRSKAIGNSYQNPATTEGLEKSIEFISENIFKKDYLTNEERLKQQLSPVNTTRFQVTDKWEDDYKQHMYQLLKENKTQEAVKFAEEYNQAIEKGEIAEFAKEHPGIATIGAVFTALPSGVEALGNAGEYALKKLTGQEAELERSQLSDISSTLRQGVSDSIDSDFGKFVYNTGVSALESISAALIPGGTFLLGASAGAATMNDLIDRGAGDGQAILGGMAAGIFEGIFERFSIGRLKSFKDFDVKTVKDFAKNFAKSTFVNASEETLTEAANIVYDTIANYDISNAKAIYDSYIEQGLAPKEARWETAKAMGSQIGESAASGALMGGTFATVGGTVGLTKNAIANAKANKSLNEIGANIKKGGDVQSYIQSVEEISNKLNLEELDSAVAKDLETAITKAKEKDSDHNIGVLSVSINRAFNEQNINDIQNILSSHTNESLDVDNVLTGKESVTNLAEGITDRAAYAQLLNSAIQGKTLTQKEMKTLKSAVHYEEIYKRVTSDPDIVGRTEATMLMNGGVNAVKEIFDKYSSSKPNVDSGTVKGYNTSRGDANELYNVRGIQGGTGESQGFSDATGTRKENKRDKAEDAVSFRRRASQDTEGTGRGKRILLEKGGLLFAYTPAKSDGSEASRAVDLLKSIGIDAIYCEGKTESNKNGITTEHWEATTSPDGTIYVSSTATLSAVNIAAHEAVHFNEIKNPEVYDKYKKIVKKNICCENKEYLFLANLINEKHYDSRYDIENEKFQEVFIRELIAHINGYVTDDINEATEHFAPMFKDWEAVVEASKQFNNDIGADFSESALLMPQNDSTDSSSDESLLTEPTVKKAEADPVRDSVFELSGRQSYTNEQLKVVAVARKFGRKVIFEESVKEQGFRSDGYFDSDGNIHLDYDTVKPLEWVLKHELTHFGEGTEEYKNYVDLLRASKAYKKWLQKELRTNEESLGKLEGFMRDKLIKERERIRERAKERGSKILPETLDPIKAQAEIIANFSATFAFAKDSRGIEALTVDMNLKEHNAFVQFVLDFISYLKKKLGGSNKTLTKELSVLEDRYLKMLTYKAQNPTTEKDSGNNSSEEKNNGNKYSISNEKTENVDKDELSIKEQLKSNLSLLNDMKVIASIDDSKTFNSKQDVIEWVLMKIKDTGNKVHRKGTGEIILDEKRIKKGLSYLKTNEERLAFALVPQVLVEGIEIGSHPKHKGRAYDTITFAAPVAINGQRGNLAVVVRKEGKNYYKAHRIVMPDGSQFVIANKKEDIAETAGGVKKDSGLSPTDNVFTNSISQSSQYSQEKIAQRETKEAKSENDSKIQYSIPTEADELLDRYESGEISRDEFMSEVEELYNRSVDTFGPIKRGEKAQEEINVPRRVEKDKKTHRFVRTELEADIFTDEMVDDHKADIILGNFSYKAISDEAAKKKADQYIKEGKGESVWDSAVNGSPVHISKETIAVGEKLLMEAVENNDRKRALELSGELCDVLTRAGQVVQAARMLKQMTGLGKLMTVQRMVKTINKDLAQKYGEDKAPFIRIDEVLAEQLANLKPGQEYEIVIRNIMEDVAAQIPSTFLDKWNAWRYFAMLANPRTHIRNLVGNGIFTPSIRIKDFIASGMEAAFVRDTSKRTKSAVIKPEYMDFAKEDVKKREARTMLSGNGQLDDRSSLEAMKKIFETEWLDKAVKGNTNLMEAEDMLFKSIHYRHALAGFLQARKVDLKNVDEKTLNEAREYAVNEAKKATFQDFSYAAEMLNHLRLPANLRKTTAGKVVDFTGQVLMGGLLPFKRTPINIIKRGIEYSPLGLAQTTIRGLYQVCKGDFNVSQFCDGLAANLTGTGLLMLGMLLCSQGLVTGGFDDDEEDRIKKLNGEQEYSVQIFGKSFTIDWAAPACIPFFIGVEVINAFEDTEDFKLSSITKAVWNALEPITNLSMLSGIQSVISSAAYADDSQKLAAIVSDIGLSYVTQGIPSVLGATSRTIDSTQRSWYNDKNSQFDTYAQLAGNTVASKVPGLSYLQIPSFDEWGRAKSRGKVGERAMENFISPGYFSSVQYDEVETELKKIFEATGERTFPTTAEKSFKVGGETKHLTADEYVVFAQAKGEMSFEYAKEFVNSAQYKKLTDAERAKVIGNLYKYATAKAKAQVSDYDITDSFKTVSKWEKNGKSVVTYYIGRALDN